MRVKQISEFAQTYTFFKCPECGEKLRVVYLLDQMLVCTKCESVYELYLRKSKQTIKQVHEDGWLQDTKK